MALRQILVGKNGCSAAGLTLIQGDANTQIIQMIVQRYYGGVDLGGLTWDVVFGNGEGKTDTHYLTDVKVGDANISCNWKPHGLATQAAGLTKFQLEGYAEDEDGAAAMVWQSGAYFFNVSEDMNDVTTDEENAALTEVHKLIMYVDKELPGVVQAGSDAATAAAAANAAAAEANAATAQAVPAAEAANAAAQSANAEAAAADKATARATNAAEEAEAARDNIQEDLESLKERMPVVGKDPETHYVLEQSDIDDTLSVAGKVADAKVVGEKIGELSEEIGGIYENDIIYKEPSFVYTAISDGTYKSVAVELDGWKPGETYTCKIASVKNNASNNVASLETYDASGTRLQQVFIEVSTGLKNTIVLDANTAAFKILYRPAFVESIAAGTVVTYSGIEIFSGYFKKMHGYDGYADLAADPDHWTGYTNISSANGVSASKNDRVSFLNYMTFKYGFECHLAYPVTLTVAKYDTNLNYLGYDSISSNRVYTPEECKNVLFRFVYLIQGGIALLETLSDDVKILYMTDAQHITDKILDHDNAINQLYSVSIVDLAANPERWTPETTIVSSTGAVANNTARVSLLDYMSFEHGFECELSAPTTLTVAKYDDDLNYLGYDSISANRAYTQKDCEGVLFRFTYLIQGGTAALETLSDDVKIKYMSDAQSVSDDIVALKKSVKNIGLEEIPDYFQDEIETTASDTLAVTYAPCITFALVTDTHQNATDKTVRNISETDRLVNFDSILHLGDVMNTMGDAQYFYDTCYAEIEAYRKSVQTGKLYATPGNHDGYALNGKKDISVDSELYRTLFRVADERTQTVREGDKPYYYVDFAKNKVRFIFLSSKSYTMTNGAYTYVYGFNDEQVKWLLDVLKNTEDGWHVMVCSHIPPIDTVLNTPTFNVGITQNNGQNIVNILQAWKNRTTVTFNGNTYDFSDLKANKFIAWLCGHVHGDMIKVYQDLTFVTVTAVAAFVPSDWVMPEGGSFVAERTKDTLTWDSWNSCVLRPDESKLYLFRFGAGEDMVVSY